MISARSRELVAASYAKWSVEGAGLVEQRAGYDVMCPPAGRPVQARPERLGGVPGQWLTPPDVAQGVILYLHGGGYVIGSSRSHASMVAELAFVARRPAFVADYRLAPEAVFPAALEDACAAYRALLARGYAPSQIAAVGDSAGGGLMLAMLLALRDDGAPLPACAVTFSAWTDLSCSGDSLSSKVDVDPVLSPAMPRDCAATYLAGHSPTDPLASPVFGDLRGFPPLLMQVGSEEILLDDTLRIAEGVRRAGGEVHLEVVDGMMHVFQMLTWLAPEATQALRQAADFIDGKLAT